MIGQQEGSAEVQRVSRTASQNGAWKRHKSFLRLVAVSWAIWDCQDGWGQELMAKVLQEG